MLIVAQVALMVALYLFVGLSGAKADDWADQTSYRESGWSAWGAKSGRREARSAEERPRRTVSSERRNRTVRVAEIDDNDEDRPQRRSRSARANRGSVGRGSVAGRETGGAVGMASYYWQPQRVASGGWFNPNAMTAAHKTLPFGTRVRVTHIGNGQSVDVTINDRGPYIAGRIIDLSRAAAGAINMTGQGVARIRMTVLGR